MADPRHTGAAAPQIVQLPEQQHVSAPVAPPATIIDQPVERELVVAMRPCDLDFSQYEGTRAQLEAEGVIPPGTEWPAEGSRYDSHWKAGIFRFMLCRSRPAGMKGPIKLWLAGDWWRPRWELLNRPDHGTCEIRREARELAAAAHLHSAAGQREWNANFMRYWKAHEDRDFQNFKTKLLPARKKPGRKPNAAEPKPCGDLRAELENGAAP